MSSAPRQPDATTDRAPGFTRRSVLRMGAGAAGSLLLPIGLGAGSGCSPARAPNILLILADDLGLECLGAYGGTTFTTPHLDQLAHGGMRFSNVFATPACAPSRAEILTGRYPFRTGWIDNAGPLSPPRLSTSEPTFARTLKSAGYATAMAGKWQLGSLVEYPLMPQESGFDESCLWSLQRVDGILRPTPDNSRYFEPRFWKNGRLLAVDATSYGPEIEFSFLTDFIARNQDRPFLAYHAMNLPHAPYHVPPGRQPPPAGTGTSREQLAAVYAMMIAYTDELVGRYVAYLTQLGLDARTLVIFSSDNGGNEHFVVDLDGREIQGGKFTLGESGSNVPFLAWQPGHVAAGAVCDDLVDFTDVLPTFAALGRATLPDGVRLDGKSFRGPLLAEGPSERTWIYTQLGYQGFIRNRHWRLATDGHLFRVKGTYSDEPADPRASTEARAAYDELRSALLDLVGDETKRVKLAPELRRGEGIAPAPAPDADRRS